MSIAYRSCAISSWVSGTTVTATMPAGVTDGDVLLMSVYAHYSGSAPTITDPAGWTLLTSANGGAYDLQKVYWRVASSEPGSYAITVSDGSVGRGAIAAFSGADTTQPASAQYGAQYNASSTNSVAPALGSWGSTNGIDVGFFDAFSTATGWTPPTNYTEPTGGDA